MERQEITDNGLKEAFSPVKDVPEEQVKQPMPKVKKKSDKKKVWGIVIFVLGLLTLAAGVAFLLHNLLKGPNVRDAEYLVEIGAWQREDEPTVIWNFTEIGKGTLTTNYHINDYDFIWQIDGDTLKIETDWLYDLNDEYTYKLDQGKNTLTLTSASGDINFVPASSVDTEVTEDN
ncbi:hypothetical protein J5868_00120 [Candidatus Saccharibacteria bacterium]|nr:hypothetical protein [Candidatus Saccharibacteria bacterium]